MQEFEICESRPLTGFPANVLYGTSQGPWLVRDSALVRLDDNGDPALQLDIRLQPLERVSALAAVSPDSAYVGTNRGRILLATTTGSTLRYQSPWLTEGITQLFLRNGNPYLAVQGTNDVRIENVESGNTTEPICCGNRGRVEVLVDGTVVLAVASEVNSLLPGYILVWPDAEFTQPGARLETPRGEQILNVVASSDSLWVVGTGFLAAGISLESISDGTQTR